MKLTKNIMTTVAGSEKALMDNGIFSNKKTFPVKL